MVALKTGYRVRSLTVAVPCSGGTGHEEMLNRDGQGVDNDVYFCTSALIVLLFNFDLELKQFID